MTTSPSTDSPAGPGRLPLRTELRARRQRGSVDGAWRPRSRELQAEAADLVDHVSPEGRIHRLLVVPSDTPPDEARWTMQASVA